MPHTPTVATALLLAACASTPPITLPPATPITAGEFPGATALVQGLSPPQNETKWFAGETILYALRLEKCTTVRRWLVRLTLLESEVDTTRGGVSSMTMRMDDGNAVTLVSPKLPVRVEVWDENGAAQGDSRVLVPVGFLRHSFLDACEWQRQPKLDESGRIGVCGAHAALISFLGILQDDDLLAGILWQVVDKPSLWSVVTGFGVALRLEAGLARAKTVEDVGLPGWSRPAVQFPLLLKLNDRHALDATITATDPWMPLGLCGGIVEVEATRPSDGSVRFTARLLAARTPEAGASMGADGRR